MIGASRILSDLRRLESDQDARQIIVLVDLDPQASATRWLHARTDAGDLLDVFESHGRLVDVPTTPNTLDGLRVV